MSRLSLIDAIFLWVESPQVPAHVAGLQIYQLPKGKGSAWLHKLMASLREVPPGKPFNQRLKPGSSARPELVEDEKLDIDYRVLQTVLPTLRAGTPGARKKITSATPRRPPAVDEPAARLWATGPSSA